MNIGERIRKLRRTLDLTQQKFGERIGIKGNTVAQYELGRNEPIDAVVSLLCREFNVREKWLRSGEGEMFNPKPSDALDQLAHQYNLSNADYIFVEKFISLTPEARKEIFGKIFGFLHEVDAALEDINPDILAYKEIPTHISEHEQAIEELETEYKKALLGSASKKGSTVLNITKGSGKEKSEAV